MEIKFGKESENQFIIKLDDKDNLQQLLVKDPLDEGWTVIEFEDFEKALRKAGYFIMRNLDFPKRFNPFDL